MCSVAAATARASGHVASLPCMQASRLPVRPLHALWTHGLALHCLASRKRVVG